MPKSTLRLALLALLALPLPAAEVAAPPRLAVVISIDQLRADYLVRFRPWFVAGGFKRLLEGGSDFQNCHYRHSITQTAPGHASILTGAFAMTHGIVSNEWLDLPSGTMVASVEDHATPLVGIAPTELGPASLAHKTGRSPHNLLATTVGDLLKQRHGAQSKVFAASNKDRSAILLGGKLADAAYWDERGKMVTSRHYRETLPPWVEAFNAQRLVDATFGRTWERLLDPALYDSVQGPDDAPGESAENGFTRTFPKTVTGGKPAITSAFYTAYDNAPFSAEFLGEFAQAAIREEQLGRHPATDLLCLSFSQIDAIGHSYGPDSHEVMDSMLRLDRVLASLFECLDREVGLARCVIVITADHGVMPLPERFAARQPESPSGRVRSADLDTVVKQALDAAFGPLPERGVWFTRDNAGYHFRPAALAAKKVSPADAAKIVKAALATVPSIAQAFTRAEILALSAEGDSVTAMMRRSYYAPRDRDVVFVLKPNFIAKTVSGTGHGSPYDYDTHVPQVWFGAGVPRGVRPERVGVDNIAPTLAALLGLPPLPQAQSRALF